LFLDLRGDDIQSVLDWFIKVRKEPQTKRLAYVMPYIPNFIISKEIKAVVKLLVQDKLNGTLESVNNFITTARLKIKIHDLKALQDIAKNLNSDEQITTNTDPQNAFAAILPATQKTEEALLIERAKELNSWLLME